MNDNALGTILKWGFSGDVIEEIRKITEILGENRVIFSINFDFSFSKESVKVINKYPFGYSYSLHFYGKPKEYPPIEIFCLFDAEKKSIDIVGCYEPKGISYKSPEHAAKIIKDEWNRQYSDSFGECE